VIQTDIRVLLAEIYETGQKNDAETQQRSKKKLNLEPDTAQFLHLFIRSSHRTQILEIGTSNGYSTIWLAWAASVTGGQVISIDRDPLKQEQADTNLQRAGLRDSVHLKCGDATQIVAGLPGPFDCVFFDADRYSAPEQLALLLPKLTPDVLLLADNVLSHPREIAAYLKALEAQPQFDKVILPIGKGLSVAYRSTVG
jgi:predicted O-methyltransferase YrrM